MKFLSCAASSLKELLRICSPHEGFLKTLAVKLIPLNHLKAYEIFKFDSGQNVT